MSDRSAWTTTRHAYQAFLRDAPGLALKTGPDLYPSVELAITSLDWLSQNSIVVLGFDGFTTDGEHIYPLLEFIADFSEVLDGSAEWHERVSRSLRDSADVLSRWKGMVQFVDMVVVSEDDPAPSV